MMKLSDLIERIKNTCHVVEYNENIEFTRRFEVIHKEKIVKAIRAMTIDDIIRENLNPSRQKNYHFKKVIYSCEVTGQPKFTKQFLYDLHKLIEAHLNLTEFKVDYNVYDYNVYSDADDGVDANVVFSFSQLGDKRPDYFEYFDIEPKQ
jgi:hypothetical protein